MSGPNWYNYSDKKKRLLAELEAVQNELDATTNEGRRELLLNKIQNILSALKDCK